jgi:hypothetical protein
MPAPFVGLPTEGATCAFSPDLDGEPCSADPTIHVLSDAPGWEVVALATCDEHAPIARAAGVQIGEHPYGPDCPNGACWIETGVE